VCLLYICLGARRWTWVDVKQGGPMADPDVWMVRDGKLYLFMYEVPKRKFLEGNVDARIKAGMAVRKQQLSMLFFSFLNLYSI